MNENHDELGRFSSGSGGSGVPKLSRKASDFAKHAKNLGHSIETSSGKMTIYHGETGTKIATIHHDGNQASRLVDHARGNQVSRPTVRNLHGIAPMTSTASASHAEARKVSGARDWDSRYTEQAKARQIRFSQKLLVQEGKLEHPSVTARVIKEARKASGARDWDTRYNEGAKRRQIRFTRDLLRKEGKI